MFIDDDNDDDNEIRAASGHRGTDKGGLGCDVDTTDLKNPACKTKKNSFEKSTLKRVTLKSVTPKLVAPSKPAVSRASKALRHAYMNQCDPQILSYIISARPLLLSAYTCTACAIDDDRDEDLDEDRDGICETRANYHYSRMAIFDPVIPPDRILPAVWPSIRLAFALAFHREADGLHYDDYLLRFDFAFWFIIISPMYYAAAAWGVPRAGAAVEVSGFTKLSSRLESDYSPSTNSHELYIGKIKALLQKYAHRLVMAKDSYSRRAFDVASESVREEFLVCMKLFGRYVVDGIRTSSSAPLYLSERSLVLSAEDTATTDEYGRPTRVALKFMRFRPDYIRERYVRMRFRLNDEYVVPILSCYSKGVLDPTLTMNSAVSLVAATFTGGTGGRGGMGGTSGTVIGEGTREGTRTERTSSGDTMCLSVFVCVCVSLSVCVCVCMCALVS